MSPWLGKQAQGRLLPTEVLLIRWNLLPNPGRSGALLKRGILVFLDPERSFDYRVSLETQKLVLGVWVLGFPLFVPANSQG